MVSSAGNPFTLQYKGADKISSGAPILKFKNLANGEVIELTYIDSIPLTKLRIGGGEFGIYNMSGVQVNDFEISVDLNGDGVLVS